MRDRIRSRVLVTDATLDAGHRWPPEPTAAARTRLTPQMHPDDAAAVAKARRGDEEAFRLLVERHSRGLYRLAHRMTGRPADAEDVVQETFVRAFRQLSRFEARSNFATWLYRIGFNCAIDYLRGRPRHESPATLDALEQMAPATGAPAVDDLVYAGEIGERVQFALDALTAQERAAFLMRHYEGSSIDEICEALDLNTSAAKHAVFRAVRKMRVALRPLMNARVENPRGADTDRPAESTPVTPRRTGYESVLRRT